MAYEIDPGKGDLMERGIVYSVQRVPYLLVSYLAYTP